MPIDDASEAGLLQAGINHMTAGLVERERIREAFGTYVDREVAEHIPREGTSAFLSAGRTDLPARQSESRQADRRGDQPNVRAVKGMGHATDTTKQVAS